jgi:hypothetical protein
MLTSFALFSGFSSVGTVPGGRAANASLVGANTVNGPGLFSVATSPAALTAATSVVWSAELTALSMMSLVGYMAAPPTIGSAGMPDTAGEGGAIMVLLQAARPVIASMPATAK